ncbi:hypothetical protein KSF_060980 [Reticulibacter mediterranei]|uniref:Uncharacterized protein n=1 Tax=Reticulibacter mediterranei TaxID=2778369 RepID=A0A8J3IPE5_9CHLR|nr:hypothetical protein KSF_060980 [Reticulibacter mediterranei]
MAFTMYLLPLLSAHVLFFSLPLEISQAYPQPSSRYGLCGQVFLPVAHPQRFFFATDAGRFFLTTFFSDE